MFHLGKGRISLLGIMDGTVSVILRTVRYLVSTSPPSQETKNRPTENNSVKMIIARVTFQFGFRDEPSVPRREGQTAKDAEC